jgi:hypothetical protein
MKNNKLLTSLFVLGMGLSLVRVVQVMVVRLQRRRVQKR